jgi:hypothetical protein
MKKTKEYTDGGVTAALRHYSCAHMQTGRPRETAEPVVRLHTEK